MLARCRLAVPFSIMKVLDSLHPSTSEHPDAEALIEEARQRQRKRRLFVIAAVLITAVASGAWVSSNGGSSTMRPVPSGKKPSHTRTPAAPSTTIRAAAVESWVFCGSGFFSHADEALLRRSFGATQFCWLSVASHTWLDIVSKEIPPQGIGGPVVLVDKCAPNHTTCLDPHALHALHNFTAYPAPDPDSALQSSFLLETLSASCQFECGVPAQGGTLALISDGACGEDIFDLATDHWYSDADFSADQLLRGNPRGALEIPSVPSFPASESPPPHPSPAPAACHFAS